MLVLSAPAKINLFLHILGQRPDGYHQLQTVFQFLNFGDELSFENREDTEINIIDKTTDIPTKSNLIYQAAKSLQSYTTTPCGADITLKKRIPIGGGLGGGSSNAATTLLALNQLWQLNLNKNILMQLALKLGADVPIFIHGEAAFAEGIGEQLTTIDLPEPWFLIVNPLCPVSTKEIFSRQELTRNSQAITIQQFLMTDPTLKHTGTWFLSNDIEPVARKLYPAIENAFTWLNQFAKAHLTGSGSCVFASFDNKMQADAILKQLPDTFQGFVAKGCNRSPLMDQLNTLKTFQF